MKPIPYAIKLSQENYEYLVSLGFNKMVYIESLFRLRTVPEYYLLPSSSGSGSGDILIYEVPPCDVISLEKYREKIFIKMLEE